MTFSVVMTKKDLLKGCDFDSPVKQYLDYWLWVQIAQKVKFYYLDKPLTLWRVHADSYINKTSDSHLIFEEGIKKFYRSDFVGLFIFWLKKMKRFKQDLISIKTGSNGHLRVLGLNIIGNDKR